MLEKCGKDRSAVKSLERLKAINQYNTCSVKRVAKESRINPVNPGVVVVVNNSGIPKIVINSA